MKYGDFTWEEILEKSHENLLVYGPRSNKKLIPPHQWIKDILKQNLGDDYEYYAKGLTENKFDKEYKVQGKLYEKFEDVTILKDNKVVGVVSFKFIASNYAQNSNNYFENLLGECYNIQANGIPFCHVFVTRYKVPYYTSEKELKRYDEFKGKYLNKYLKLYQIEENESIPKKVSVTIIHINGATYNDSEIHPTKFKSLEKREKDKILNDITVELYDNSDYNEDINEKLEQMEIHKVLSEFADIIRENDL